MKTTHNERGAAHILFLALIIVVLAAVALAYSNWNNARQAATTPTSTPTPTSTAAAEPAPAGFKRYTEQKYGFSFLYPVSWNIGTPWYENETIRVVSPDHKRDASSGINMLVGGADVVVVVNDASHPSTESLKADYDDGEGFAYKKDFTMSTVGGKPAVKSTCGHYVEGQCYEWIANGKLFEISYSPSKAGLYSGEFEAIVKSVTLK